MRVALLLALFFFSILVFSQEGESLLKNGPMLGRTELREATVWLQTAENGPVWLSYVSENDRKTLIYSDTLIANKHNFCALTFLLDELEPGTTYYYNVHVKGRTVRLGDNLSFHTQPLWQYRTDPPAFTVALGSCTYVNEPKYDRPGDGYGGEYEIFESIAAKNPDMMLWLGDNIYLREVDWSSRAGIAHRYTHTRQIKEMRTLLQTANNYAIWDDHDYGPNDANYAWIHKDYSKEMFDLFWANPENGVENLNGTTTAFQYMDMDFFLLDNRWDREDHRLGKKNKMLGKEQMDWLIHGLKYSKSPFKFVAVGGQMLNDHAVYENFAQFEEERQYLIDQLKKEDIKNVFFLTGDRHHTELSVLEDGAFVAYDLTVSSLTSKVYDFERDENSLSLKETQVAERNFGLLKFSGPRKERVMEIEIYDVKGELLWTKTIESE